MIDQCAIFTVFKCGGSELLRNILYFGGKNEGFIKRSRDTQPDFLKILDLNNA
jgi:hypothetical protein